MRAGGRVAARLATLRARAYLHLLGLGRLARIPTDLTAEEKALLHRLARGLPRGAVVVEIGSYLGASSCLLAAGIRGRGGLLYCIDTWTNDAMSEGARDTWEAFRRNTAPFGAAVRPLRGRSAELAGKVAAEAPRVDLLFIDADHTYAACRSDWERYVPLLRPGGVVVLHDTGWSDGVRRVATEQAARGARTVAELPNMRALRP